MTSGYYAAAAGLVAKSEALDVVANNVANLNTVGFKVQREFYRSLTASSTGYPLSPLNRAVNNFGVLGGAAVDLRPGNLEPTGNPFDVAIEGPGFLAVQSAAGVRYTRNGNLRLGTNRELLSADGDRVLGENGPLSLPTGQVSISADGTVSVNGAVAGRLKVVDFAPGTPLMSEGGSYFRAPANTERPAADARVHQGMLEAANQNPVAGVAQMIVLQRHTEMLQRALSIFHSEFGRATAEELARV